MPDFGTSNRVAVRAIEETTWGTTPTSPALQAMRFTSESLNYNADFVTSEEIRADRMTPDTIQVASSADGDVSGELSFGSYDDLIQAAMYSTWITTGSTVSADTGISIAKTGGTPNTWSLDSSVTDLSAQSWTLGQFVKIEGLAVAGTFYAQITGAPVTGSAAIAPLIDVATEAAGDAVTITPMNFLRNGTTKRSFTFQKSFGDLATEEFQNFTGTRIGSWGIELSTGSILTTTFGLMSKDSAMTETQFSGASVVAANTNSVLNAVDDVAAISFDGDPAAQSYYFNTLSVTLDNALRGQQAVSNLGFVGVEAGRIDLTGSVELYFENSALYDTFRAATAFSLSFVVEDSAGNAYAITIPNAKYTSMNITAGGLDQDIMASAEFTGLINSAGTYQYQISRLGA